MKALLESGWPGVLTLTGPKLGDYAKRLPMDGPLRVDLPPLACTPPRVSRIGEVLPATWLIETLDGQSLAMAIENMLVLKSFEKGKFDDGVMVKGIPPDMYERMGEAGEDGRADFLGGFFFRGEGSNPAAHRYYVKLLIVDHPYKNPDIYLYDGDGRQFAHGTIDQYTGTLHLTEDPSYPKS